WHQNRELLLYPLLAQRLAEYLGVSGDELPHGNELNTVACRFLAQGNQVEDIYPALKTIMPKNDELSVPEPLMQLASIRPLKLFVSTTFDPLLEWALNQVRFGGQERTQNFAYAPNAVEDLPSEIARLDRPVVFYLFGRLSAIPAYVVTQEDTLEFVHSLQSEISQPHLLFDELNRNNLLILGSCFDDWLARFFIRTAKRQRLLMVRGSTDYLADTKVSSDNNLMVFLHHFSSRTKIFRDGDPVEFVKELHRRWLEQYATAETQVAEPIQARS